MPIKHNLPSLVASLDNLPLGLFILRRDYTVLFWNRCLEQWTGLASQEMLETDIRSRFPNLGDAEFAGRLEQVFQTGAPTIFSSQLHHHVIPVPRPDGAFRHQHTMVSSVPDQEGEGFHALFAIQDVTDLTELAILHRQARDQALNEVAARGKTEEALRRAKEESERILRVVPSAIFTVDHRQRIVRWNSRAEELTGYAADEVVGIKCTEFVLAPCLNQCGLLDENKPKPIIGAECSIKRKDGQIRLLRKNVDAIRDDQGRIVGGIESFEDITEQRRSEQALLESEERYRVAIEASSDGVCLLRDDIFLFANTRMANILGFERPGGLVGRDVKDFVHPKYRELVHQYSLRRRAGLDAPAHFELIALRGQTDKFPVEISAAQTYYQGQPVTLGFVRDISERKRAEEELRKLSRAVEQSLASVVITDRTGAIEYVNDKFCELTGYSREEALGQNPRILKSGLMDPLIYVEMWRALTDQGHWRGEFLNRKKNGELFWETAAISAIRKGNGQATHYVAVKENITERKRAEAELRAAKEAAESATQAKSAFLAAMSHEIRTPLNGVIGMTGLLLDTDLSHEQRQFASTARSSAETLLTLINDILDLSKIESGHLELERTTFAAHRLVEDVLEVVSAAGQAKGLDLWSVFERDLPAQVVGDPGRFRQVLFNLVGNAVKFTERGEVGVRVAREKRDSDMVWLRVEVSDTGLGISEQDLARLFTPFTQADASTTRRFGGTGLGLSISKRLVEMMGGRIGAQSRPGQGSVFWFTLPLPEAPGQPEATEAEAGSLAGVRVLCVESNASALRGLVATLTQWGMICETASSGPEAIQSLRASQGETESACRLALVELRPPDMDGLNLAHILREDKNMKSVLLVGLSPLAAAGPHQERARAVFDAILPKPPRRDALRACLLSLLGKGDMKRGPGTAYPPPHPAVVPSRRARILLAEDNPVNQQLAVHLLAKMGHRVDLAGNGREAVEMAANFAYDLIFMDVQMPELDGLAATREIRLLPGPAGRIPIIAMTAHALAGDRQRCLAAGMDDYVSKPINPRDLAEALQRQLSRPGPEASPPAAWPARVETGVVFDLKELSARLDGDQALMAELAQIFLSSAPARLPPLEAAVTERDYPAVVFLAHGLKGELGNLSAKAAAFAAGELEAAAKTGDQDRAEAAWRALREEFSRFVAAMGQAGLVRPESTGA